MASRRYNFLRQILPWPSAKSHLRLQEHGKKDSTPFSFYLPSFLALFVRALWCKQRRLFSSHFGKGTWGSCRAVDNGDVIHFSRSVLRSSLPPSLSLFPSLSPSLPPITVCQVVQFYFLHTFTWSHFSLPSQSCPPALQWRGCEGSGKDHTSVLWDREWKPAQTKSTKRGLIFDIRLKSEKMKFMC